MGPVALAALAVAATVLLYRPTLEYGFHYDDYHFIRPYSAGELRAALRGPWDSSGIELPFYRPLTVAFYAARFQWFGLEARAHHALSLALFSLAALLLGTFVSGVSGRRWTGTLAVLLFVAHPSMPYALAAWITNQMHLVETIVVLLAFVWWWSVARMRHVGWWVPLLLLGATAFLVKEDGVMLLPSILALHWLHRRVVEPGSRPVPLSFALLAAALLALLVFVRAEAVGDLRTYSLPDLDGAWRNFSRGLDRVFRLVPPDRPWQPVASWFATLLPLAGLLSWKRAAPELRFLLAAGALLAVAFNLPFVFVTKLEQMHLVATGAVLVLVGSSACVLSSLPGSWRPAVTLALLAGIASFAAVARDITTDFEPYGPVVMATDEIVLGWAAVPEELRDYLRSKREPGAKARVPSNPLEALDVVAFGLHPRERSADGTTYRWMAYALAEIHVRPSARYVEIPLRHEIGAFREPARVEVHADGRLVDAMVLADDDWRVTRIALRSTRHMWRQAHRIHLTIPHAWKPAEIIRGSRDDRTLGIKIGEILVR